MRIAAPLAFIVAWSACNAVPLPEPPPQPPGDMAVQGRACQGLPGEALCVKRSTDPACAGVCLCPSSTDDPCITRGNPDWCPDDFACQGCGNGCGPDFAVPRD